MNKISRLSLIIISALFLSSSVVAVPLPDVLSDSLSTFLDMKALPIEERRKAFFELHVPKEHETERDKNNRELAFIIDSIGGLCEYTSEDFKERVLEFKKQNKSFDINAVAGMNSAFKESFLHKAAGNCLNDDPASLIKFLVEQGAALDVLDGQGWTPLHTAVHFSRADAVEALLHCGADKSIKDKKGLTALDLSERYSCDERTIAGQNNRRIRELLTGLSFRKC